MNFVYILAGWEGIIYNSRVISSVKVKGFKVLFSKYYIADIRYFNMPIMLTSYYSI